MDDQNDVMNQGKAPADPHAQGSMKGNKDWGKGRGRADSETKGDRSVDAPKGGHGLGKGRGKGRADEEVVDGSDDMAL